MSNCKKCFDSATDAYTEFLKLKLKCETLERENDDLKSQLDYYSRYFSGSECELENAKRENAELKFRLNLTQDVGKNAVENWEMYRKALKMACELLQSKISCDDCPRCGYSTHECSVDCKSALIEYFKEASK